MATFVLDGKASAELPRRPIAVSLTVAGPSGGARLLDEGRGGRQVRVVQHTGSLLILPRVDEETTVSAVPDGRDRFGQGTVLHVTLGPDDPSDLGADVIQLTPRDVSGLSFIELATLVPVDAGTVGVTTKLAVPDAPLPPVAAHARVACRGVLHRDQVDEADRVRVGCVVDTSVSMAPLFASGTVAAAGDIVAGLAAVLSGGEDVELAAPGPSGADRAAYSASELGDHLRQSPVAGFGYAVDLNPAVGPHDRVVGGVAVGPSLTVVITDGRGVVEFAEGVVALVLSHSASVSSGPGFAGAVCPLPPPGVGGRDFLAGQPQLVSRVVADLLAASGRAGAGLAGAAR